MASRAVWQMCCAARTCSSDFRDQAWSPPTTSRQWAATRSCFATGRSDYPNQINNSLAFPGIFRGALDVEATDIDESMKLAAAQAIAGLVGSDELNEEYIVPSMFDKRVADAVASATREAAWASGVARKALPPEYRTPEHDAEAEAWFRGHDGKEIA